MTIRASNVICSMLSRVISKARLISVSKGKGKDEGEGLSLSTEGKGLSERKSKFIVKN